jgi:hypothetical protein
MICDMFQFVFKKKIRQMDGLSFSDNPIMWRSKVNLPTGAIPGATTGPQIRYSEVLFKAMLDVGSRKQNEVVIPTDDVCYGYEMDKILWKMGGKIVDFFADRGWTVVRSSTVSPLFFGSALMKNKNGLEINLEVEYENDGLGAGKIEKITVKGVDTYEDFSDGEGFSDGD